MKATGHITKYFSHVFFICKNRGEIMKKVSSVIWGIVLIAAGALFALNVLNITNVDVFLTVGGLFSSSCLVV